MCASITPCNDPGHFCDSSVTPYAEGITNLASIEEEAARDRGHEPKLVKAGSRSVQELISGRTGQTRRSLGFLQRFAFGFLRLYFFRL